MLANKNHIAVKRLSRRLLKQNKTRNLFTIVAIILTTFMFTSVFSIGISMGKNLNVMMLREQGTKATIYLKHPTKSQMNQVKKATNLNGCGLQIVADKTTIRGGEQRIQLLYFDATEFQKNYYPAINKVHGNYPKAENEIMLPIFALDKLNIKNPKQGMKIRLQLDQKQEEFILSGWYKEYISQNTCIGLVSGEYCKKNGYTMQKDGQLSISSKPGKQSALLDELEDGVSLRPGQKIDSNYDVQSENASNYSAIAVLIGLLGLIIIISGYLLIYNVMYISVAKDIRLFGLLKTLGTTPKQIRSIVKKQILYLSGIGIPVGVLLGTILSFWLVPKAMSMFSAGQDDVMPNTIFFSPLIYIGTIVFAYLTIRISCNKPARLAAKVSPVEAVKYNGISKIKMKAKHTTDGGKLYKIAYRNVFREKKRAILVFASLFMGTIALLSVHSFISSFKLENYLSNYYPYDATIYFSDDDTDSHSEAEALLSDMVSLPGVKKVYTAKSMDAKIKFDENVFAPFLKHEEKEGTSFQDEVKFYKEHAGTDQAYSAPIIVADRNMMEKYNSKARQKIDIDKFEAGKCCLVGYCFDKKDSDRMVGKTITLINPKTKKQISMKIGASPLYDEEYGISIGYYWELMGAPSCILLSEKAAKELGGEISMRAVSLDCEKNAEKTVSFALKKMAKQSKCIQNMDIKLEACQYFTNATSAMNGLSTGISLILILIGMLNFINVMITGVYIRKPELAVLESVGMTKSQICKMLVYEGGYYGVITIAILMTVGNGILYLVGKLSEQVADYAVFSYPFGLTIVMCALILIICMGVPLVVYRQISKETVTQRLRAL